MPLHDRKILSASISVMPLKITDPMPEVTVVFEDGVSLMLFSYYPDEINFSADEFIGLTEQEARQLRGTKDLAYLQGGPAGDARF